MARELTEAQRKFLAEIKPHVTYRAIGKHMATARRLEALGIVTIVQGYFAYLTDTGRAALEANKP